MWKAGLRRAASETSPDIKAAPVAIAGLLSANHGYWGGQMIAPYVDAEVG
jgi:hypothetical protein